MKEQIYKSRLLCAEGISAQCDGVNLLSIGDTMQAFCHLCLQKEGTQTVVFSPDRSLTYSKKKVAFTARLFSDFERFLADCAFCDEISNGILTRTFHCAQKLTFSICCPARTQILPLSPYRDLCGLLLRTDTEKQLLIAWRKGVQVQVQESTLSLCGSGALFFAVVTENDIAKVLSKLASLRLNKTAPSAVSATPLQMLTTRICDNGRVLPYQKDDRYDPDTQAQVLRTLCRLGKPCDTVAQCLFSHLQKETPDAGSAIGVLAVIRYALYSSQPIPAWCEEILHQSARLLLCGMMPFSKSDALPFPVCEYGSLCRTLQWLSAVDTLLCHKESDLREKADLVRARLRENFTSSLVCKARAEGLRHPQFRFGICPDCHARYGETEIVTLTYHKKHKTYLCAKCAQKQDICLDFVIPPLFETFGYCDLADPKLDLATCAIEDLIKYAYFYRTPDARKALDDRIETVDLETLSSISLCYLAKLEI